MKKLIAILLVLLTAFMVFAEGQKENPATQVADDTAAVEEVLDPAIPTGDKPTSRIKLVVWSTSAGDALKTLQSAAAEFSAQSDLYDVEVIYTSNIYTKMVTSTPAERPNIVHTTDNESARYIETIGTDDALVIPAQTYIDYDNYDTSTIINNLKGVYQRDGKWMAIPIGNSNVGFYYNVELLEAHGIDWRTLDSYEDIYEAALKLKNEGVQWPVYLRVDSADFLNCGLVAEGLDWFNNDNGRSGIPTKALFDDPEVKDAVMTYFNVVHKMKENDLIWACDYTASDQRNMFSKGEIAILSGYASTYRSLYTLCQGTGLKFAYSVFPTFRASTVSQGQTALGFCYFIGNVEDAWAEYGSWLFIKYLLTDEWAAKFAINSGYLPVTTTAAQTAEYQAYIETENPYAPEIIAAQDATPIDHCLPLLPYQKDYANAFSYVLKKLINDVTYTPEEAYEKLVEDTKDAIEMYFLEIGVVLTD